MEGLVALLVLIVLLLGSLRSPRRNTSPGCLATLLQDLLNRVIGALVAAAMVLLVIQVVRQQLQQWMASPAPASQPSTTKPTSSSPATPTTGQDTQVTPLAPCQPYRPPPAGQSGSFGESREGGKRHSGVDLLASLYRANAAQAPDTPVRSIADGQLCFRGSFGGGWGYAVLVEHQLGGQPCVAVYGHIVIDSTITGLALNGPVTRGQVLGRIDKAMYGPDGDSSPHLHFGLWRGTYAKFPRSQWGLVPEAGFPGTWVDPTALVAPEQG